MPRGPRDDAPGVVHHVMARGIERRLVFHDDTDRFDLVRRLSRLCPELGFHCLAWALMPNHFHLVLRSGRARVSRLMARLGTGYAKRFNERHDRVGHLFQNRYRSRRAVDDRDVLGLILYVCRNPLDGGIVRDVRSLERFAWCSVGALIGARAPRRFESVGETLALFDDDPARARRHLREALGAPELAAEPDLTSTRPQQPPPPRASMLREDTLLAELLRDVCARHAVAEGEVRARRRDPVLVEARRSFAMRAARELGSPSTEIARVLGVSISGVSRMLSRSERR
jgi:REP element-mobilizing transposase RayT